MWMHVVGHSAIGPSGPDRTTASNRQPSPPGNHIPAPPGALEGVEATTVS